MITVPPFSARPPAPPPPAAGVPAELGAVASEQARFRIEGSGPIASRRIEPASHGARQLFEVSETGVTQAVRGVLRVIEHAAGGAAASSAVRLNGIALSDGMEGHGANEFQAHMDNDTAYLAAIARMDPQARGRDLEQLAASAIQAGVGTKAHVTSGWVNLGHEVTASLLATRGMYVEGTVAPVTQESLATAIRVLRHEAEHVVDHTEPALPANAKSGLREALAEAGSATLPELAAARTALGLDHVVSDATLAAAASVRPYAADEAALQTVLARAGVAPGSPEATAVLNLPSATVADKLVQGVAGSAGMTAAAARAFVANAFAPAPQ